MVFRKEQQSVTRYPYGLLMLILFCLATGVYLSLYLPALSYPFQFDDWGNVVLNRSIRHWGEWSALYDSFEARKRPLTHLSFAWNFSESGLSVSEYRKWNVAIHWMNSLLLFSLLKRFYSGPAAMLGSILFLLHPLAAENVIYVSGRASLLALLFSLSALLILALPLSFLVKLFFWNLFAVLGLAAKESAAALLPLVFLLAPLCSLSWKRVLVLMAPMLLVVGGILWSRWSFVTSSWDGVFLLQDSLTIESWSTRIWYTISLWPGLMAKLIFPWGASIDHAFPLDQNRWPHFLLGLSGLVVLAWGIRQWIRKRTSTWLAYLMVAAALAPTHSLILTLDPLGERHLYPALLAPSFFLAILVHRGVRFSTLLWVLPLLSLPLSHARIGEWRSSVSLWQSAHQLYPGSFRIIYNLATSKIQELGTHGAAIADLLNYLRKAPVLRFEQWDRMLDFTARAVLQESIESGKPWIGLLGPLDHPSLYFLALRIEGMEKSVPQGPLKSDAPPLLLSWLSPVSKLRVIDLLRLAEAERASQDRNWILAAKLWSGLFAQFEEDHSPIWPKRKNLAQALDELGRKAEAQKQFELLAFQYKVYKQYPADVFLPLLRIYEEQGDWRRASDVLGELLRVQTDDPDLRERYSAYLEKQGMVEAKSQREKAARYRARKERLPEDFEWVRP
jgi:hypothetical protein